MFQSTRPRRARPTQSCSSISTSQVSIHAPAKGATYILRASTSHDLVSIHAPAKGATAQL
ncbi:MAG TPA: hypothetical protein ENJ32_09625 [Crenotrichaceae bacterium]|nr:hypothetical protein [Crenotrichaceae bacterium]